jgi:hypothetical protein
MIGQNKRKSNNQRVQPVMSPFFRVASECGICKEQQEEKSISKERTEPVQTVDEVFFPLDEILHLQPGSLTPLQLEHLTHFASFHSFGQAVKMLMKHHGVQISVSTSRRQTECIGASAEQVQNEQAKAAFLRKNTQKEKEREGKEPEKFVISNDGAHISLRGKAWAEVKTMAVGEVQENKKRSKQRPSQEVKMSNISYFSRMIDSDTFSELVTGELDHRGFFQAKEVGAVQDGAEWIQSLLAIIRADAVRILDFYHAGQYLNEIAQFVTQAGTSLPEKWLEEQLHELKHQGAENVLAEVNRLLQEHPPGDDCEQKVKYLQKREEMMRYPQFQQQGWPIGSGSVESANVGVVQSRLKGIGMHWERKNVNPMLALRLAVCNDRWDETREQAFHQRLVTRRSQRVARQVDRYDAMKQKLEKTMLHLFLLASPSKPHQTNTPSSSPLVDPVSPSAPKTPKTRIPAPSHPWRRYSHAKK